MINYGHFDVKKILRKGEVFGIYRRGSVLRAPTHLNSR